MRALFLIAAAALALAGCDQLQNPFGPKAAKPAPAAQAAAPAPAPAPAAPPAEPAAAPASAAPAPAVIQPVRWSPADYGKREAHLAALIANAETRDTSGETQRRAAEGRARRAHCATRACIEGSYAAEEAWLKQWEGSGG